MVAPAGWTISATVPRHAVGLFTRGLETLGAAVSIQEEEGDLCSITAFTPIAPDRAALTASLALATRLSGIPEPDIAVAPLADTDWLEENRRDFAPIEAGRFFIHPDPFDGHVPAGAIALALNAGAAFGTGAHASTKGCLHALDRLHRRGFRFSRMLDLGCGSGILAIAAARLWRRPVTAVDIDPVAVAVTRANARANGVRAWISAHRADGADKRGVTSRYELVTANILARPLIAMAGSLTARCAPGSVLILSGITGNQTATLQAAYRRPGFRFLETITEDGWATLMFARMPGAMHSSMPSQGVRRSDPLPNLVPFIR